MIKDILIVGSGSALGGIARFLIGKLVMTFFPYSFPMATFLINIAGSFLIGLAYAMSGKSGSMSPASLIFLATGFLGGFTTFSSFGLETMQLIQSKAYLAAFSYVTLSNVIGIVMVLAAYQIASA